MKVPLSLSLVCLLAQRSSGALVGYGIWPCEPVCAFACDMSFSSLNLGCSTSMPMDSEMNSGTAMTTPQCRASDTPWLTSLAWCMHTQCAGYDVSASDLEKFWEEQITGDPTVVAKWTYAEALFNISQPPTNQISEIDKMLNSAALVNAEDYQAQFNAMKSVERESIVESAYGYVVVIVKLSKGALVANPSAASLFSSPGSVRRWH